MNPQLENGHTRIANEIMDALAGIRIPGQARQVLDVIIRKTYGWQKKTDKISLSQFAESTGMTKVTVSKAINKLLKMNLITKEGSALSCFTKKGNDYSIIYGLQKDYGKWLPLPKKVTLPKKVKNVTQKGMETLPKMSTTKETITKETITKDIYIEKFSEFWDKYDYKLSKPDCIEYWEGKKKLKNGKRMNEDMRESCLSVIGRYVENTYKNGNYPSRKHPKTYLYNSSWDDEIVEIVDKEPAGTVEERMAEGRRLYENGNNTKTN